MEEGGGGSTIILLGAGRSGRTSIGLFLPRPPCRQVLPFTSVCVCLWGGGEGGGAFCPPVVLCPPREPRGLPIQSERVDTCLQTHVSTSRTGGASSPPQKYYLHSPICPDSLWENVLCECRPPQCVLHTPLRWYERQKWQPLSVRGILTPFAAALSIAVQILNSGSC